MDRTVPAQGRQSRLSAARSAEILEAALAVLGETGYQGVTMAAVAARAQCSTATLYRHWGGRPGLVVAALRTHSPPPVDNDTGSLRGDLITIVRGIADVAAESNVVAALLHAALRDPHLADAVRTEVLAHGAAALARAVDRAVARGEIGAQPEEVHRYCHQAVVGLAVVRRLVEGRLPDRAYLEGFVDAVLLPALGSR